MPYRVGACVRSLYIQGYLFISPFISPLSNRKGLWRVHCPPLPSVEQWSQHLEEQTSGISGYLQKHSHNNFTEQERKKVRERGIRQSSSWEATTITGALRTGAPSCPWRAQNPLLILQTLQLLYHKRVVEMPFWEYYSSVLKPNASILGFKKGNFRSHLTLRSHNKSIFSMQDLKCQESN